MILQEALDTADIGFTLEEGIVFFKNSKKMKKLSNVIIQKSQFIEDEDKRRQITILAGKVIKLSEKFEGLEQLYKNRKLTGKSSAELKQKYRALETEYIDIVNLAKKEQTKNILKSISAYTTMVAAMILPTLLIGKLSKEFGTINPITNSKDLNPFAKAAVYMSSAGLIRGVSPTNRIENLNKDVVNKASTSLQNKEIL